MNLSIYQFAARVAGVLASLTIGLTLAPMPATAADDLGRSMLDYSYSRAVLEFYKRTTDETLLDGAVT